MPTATETTTFRSKDQTLRLVKERTTVGLNTDGTQNVKPDVTIEFSNVGGRGEYVPANDPQFRDDTFAELEKMRSEGRIKAWGVSLGPAIWMAWKMP